MRATQEWGRYPSFIEACVLAVLYIILQMLCGLIAGSFGGGISLSENNSISFIVNIIVIPLFTGTAVISYALWRAGDKWGNLFREKEFPASAYLTILVMFFALSMVLAEVDNLVRHYFPLTDIWLEIFQTIFQANIVLSLIGIAIIPPVIEEIIFRGIILKGFLKLYSPFTAIFLSSILFSLIHLNIWQMTTALLAGLLLGWLYYLSGSLILVIFAHGIFNAISVLGNRYVSIQEITATLNHQPFWMSFIGLLLLVGTIIIFRGILKRINISVPDNEIEEISS